MLDSHCHLDDARFDLDRVAVAERARAAGVTRVLVPGLHARQWPALRRQATTQGWLYAVGTHPWSLPEGRDVPVDVAGASAIGECGLDAGVAVPMEEQVDVLVAHLAVAREAGLPVILHCVRAHDRLPAVLRRFAPVRGVMHSYSGGPGLVDTYVRLGLHLSFAGIVTHANARRPIEALRRVPAERLLAETDAPDQCPAPHRGRSEPSYLPLIVDAMERWRGEPLRRQLDANARTLGW